MIRYFIGKPIDPFSADLFKKTTLIAFFAWIGLGADGLSSSCYGPEQAFLALGHYHHLALFVSIGMILSVFVIALSYNQVIELFPSGGGGYKVSSQLLGPAVGVVSGSTLIIDYVLTIAISIASGMDALYSFFPKDIQFTKLPASFITILFLLFLNLRGMKESIRALLPIFLGFVITHIALLIYGTVIHTQGVVDVTRQSISEAHALSGRVGFLMMLAFILHAYSLGSGTYTGIEAVSNNVNKLAEPRVKTGKLTMLYMAISLSLVAGGITFLYMLWHVEPSADKTLNAILFAKILGSSPSAHAGLIVTLLFEAGILFVAANTGFLAGPTVLANMAVDNWFPRRFRLLSSRLVNSQGIIFFGVAALIILLLSRGNVSWLIVLYSINVFMTFCLTTLGMCRYWFTNRAYTLEWWTKCVMSLIGFILTSVILVTVLISKFFSGGSIAILVTGLVIFFCFMVRRHNTWVGRELRNRGRELLPPLDENKIIELVAPDAQERTAIIFVSGRVLGMHCLNWVLKNFPGYFKNMVFVSVGQVDIKSFTGKRALKRMAKEVDQTLDYFVRYCQQKNIPATSFADYGGDLMEQLVVLCQMIGKQFPQHMFFASQMSFYRDTWFKRFLHNGVSYTLQRRLHALSEEILLIPMSIN